jgi:hypothetical protein
MKIIDQTPFYKENGELSIVDRGKAIMQFGFGWFKEIEAQKAIIAVFDKILEKISHSCKMLSPRVWMPESHLSWSARPAFSLCF